MASYPPVRYPPVRYPPVRNPRYGAPIALSFRGGIRALGIAA